MGIGHTKKSLLKELVEAESACSQGHFLQLTCFENVVCESKQGKSQSNSPYKTRGWHALPEI